MSSSIRGFILQPTYRIERGRPVVHLWGRLETGETFLVRDDRLVPHFYIEADDCGRARELGVRALRPSDRQTAGGRPVTRIEIPTPPDTPSLRDRLHRAGIATFEADVRFAMRYLIDHGIRGALSLMGESRPQWRVDRVYQNPAIRPESWSPRLSVLSLDIETDPEASRLLSIGLYGCGLAEVLLLTREGLEVPQGARGVESEAELLKSFCRRVREADPDILTGWNVADFDFSVLLRRAQELRQSLALGRGPGPTRYRPGRGFRQASQVMIPGRVVLDGPELLRGAFIRLEQYSLDFVAREILGEGKTLRVSGRADEILECFEQDRARFVEYNLTDARLVIDILERLQLVELAVERSLLTGLPLDRVSSSVAALDFLYLQELGKRRVVAPSVRTRRRAAQATSGGHVFAPTPGLYRNVLVLDFKSLYPSLIRTFHIDPLGYVERPEPGDPVIRAPNDAAFRPEAGVLGRLLDELFPRREEAERSGHRVASYAIKILMNSFFGVLATPVCRFYNPAVANAITESGRRLLLWSRERLESWGHRVLYGDTDSLFVEAGLQEATPARQLGARLVARLNRDLAEYVRREWRVTSRLEVELEELYLRLLLPPTRHGGAGARKRYAGLVDRQGKREVVFVGLEAVRRDWTDLARSAQRELYRRLFFDEPVEEYLRQLVARLRAGQIDEQLIYRKALRKELDAYTSTTPPHVAAARKLGQPVGNLISYVMTVNGPEPAADRKSAIDYRHYLDKQLQPIAAPVLELLGLDFAKLLGDDRQMELF